MQLLSLFLPSRFQRPREDLFAHRLDRLPGGFPTRRVLCSSSRRQKAKTPMINSPGFLFWRRPTLARPFAVLPSGLQRFTSVFGMGTGGATTLMSPERRSACAARLWWKRLRCSALVCDSRFVESLASGASHSEAATVDSRFSVHDSDFQRAADSLTSTYRKKNVIRDSLHCYIGFSDSRFNVSTIHGLQELRFVLRSFLSSVCRSAKARNGLTEK